MVPLEHLFELKTKMVSVSALLSNHVFADLTMLVDELLSVEKLSLLL